MAAHILQVPPATIIDGSTQLKVSKVGNQTNSQDPQAVNSRVFVGNLNTFQCSKTDVERMFQRYGRIAGISMHKGYAFIQFTNPFDARSACLGEDGRVVLGQILDVNLVAEPKPHQTGRKRQNVSKTGNDWDYYYDSYCSAAAAAAAASIPQRLVPPLKRPRLMLAQARSLLQNALQAQVKPPQQQQTSPLTDTLKTYSNPDILICGNCREMFSELQELLDHKKSYCKLRFTCKCSTTNGLKQARNDGATLLCSQCKDPFASAWDLMVHVQAAHMVNIYELGMPRSSNGNGISVHTSPAHSPSASSKEDESDHHEEIVEEIGAENCDSRPEIIDCDINGSEHSSPSATTVS